MGFSGKFLGQKVALFLLPHLLESVGKGKLREHLQLNHHPFSLQWLKHVLQLFTRQTRIIRKVDLDWDNAGGPVRMIQINYSTAAVQLAEEKSHNIKEFGCWQNQTKCPNDRSWVVREISSISCRGNFPGLSIHMFKDRRNWELQIYRGVGPPYKLKKYFSILQNEVLFSEIMATHYCYYY